MEEHTPVNQLAEIERDRLGVYLARPRTPAWYWPVLGLATALMFASNDLGHPLLTVGAVVAYAAVIGALVAYVSAAHGAIPRLRGMPPILARPLIGFMALAGGFILVGGAATSLLAVPWSFTGFGVVSGAILWLGGWATSRVYEARAEALAKAAGIRR